MSQIQGGNIKALAIATKQRSPALPDVPTTEEAGMPEFEVSAWNALFAPKGAPKDAVDKLAAALDKALDDEGTRKRLLDLGSVIPDKAGRTPAALQSLVESEVARWTPGAEGGRRHRELTDVDNAPTQQGSGLHERTAPLHFAAVSVNENRPNWTRPEVPAEANRSKILLS